jgi:hypothetical protein
MKPILRLLTWLPATLLLSWYYALGWLDHEGIRLEKPYVYRQLVPLAASAMVWLTGMDRNQAVVLVVVLSGLGLAFASHYLYRSFHAQ